MNSYSSHVNYHSHEELPVALLDVQNTSLVNSIREFLETNGCSVCVNSKPTGIPIYHIIIGNRSFVKRITEEIQLDTTKRLILLLDDTLTTAQSLVTQLQIKVVLLNSHILSSREVSDIFSFFFRSSSELLDIRTDTTRDREPMTEEPVEQIKNESVNDMLLLESSDRSRINEIVTDVFRGKTSTTPGTFSQKNFRVNPEHISEENVPGIQKNLQHQKKLEEMSKLKISRNKSNRLKKFFIGFLLLILPFVWYLIAVSIGISGVALAGRLIASGDMLASTRAVALSRFGVDSATLVLSWVSTPFSLVGAEPRIRDQERLLAIIRDLGKSEESAGGILTTGQELAKQLLSPIGSTQVQTPQPGAVLIERLRNELFFIHANLGETSANLNNFIASRTFPFSFQPVLLQAIKAQELLSQLQGTIEFIDRLLTLYSRMSGFTGKRTYLVLFQNSMELRPTGGFIGSIGLATMFEGRLVDFQIQDVYTLDGQLRGHVDPPKPIRELLGQEHWYLRDSNWDPDFPTSGARAAWFYTKEQAGVQLDGVIALNTQVVVDLLATVGPVTLTDFNDTITSENFFGKSLYYTQINFFPGSTQKKDFLGSLAKAIVEKLTSQNKINPSAIFRAVKVALDRHDILFAFNEQELQTLAGQYEWAGRLPYQKPCINSSMVSQSPSCLLDYLSVIEANLGVNKSNYFIKRDMLQQVSISPDGSVQNTLTLAYRNTSQGETGGAGKYLTYTRFVVPSDAQITQVTLENIPVPLRESEINTPALPYYEIIPPTTRGFRVIGIAFIVPPRSDRRITLTYKREKRLEFTNGNAVYDLTIQKQPGMSDQTVHLIITYPLSWTTTVPGSEHALASLISPTGATLLANDGLLEYNRDLVSDVRITVFFQK